MKIKEKIYPYNLTNVGLWGFFMPETLCREQSPFYGTVIGVKWKYQIAKMTK